MHLYCVIDIGSNTIRLVIYTLEDGQLRQALSSKATAGLAGFVEDGALSEEGIERMLGVLRRFRGVLSLLPDCKVYPFATASLRGLSNTQDILERVERETGFKIDVITGREEAILDYRGAVGRMQERSGVLVDIGGGSTELVFFRSREVIAARSLPLGSLSLFNRFVSGVIPDKQELREMRAEAVKGHGPRGKRALHLLRRRDRGLLPRFSPRGARPGGGGAAQAHAPHTEAGARTRPHACARHGRAQRGGGALRGRHHSHQRLWRARGLP